MYSNCDTLKVYIQLRKMFNGELRRVIRWCKVIMQGNLIAVAYTLRTYRNQFSLGGICKQE